MLTRSLGALLLAFGLVLGSAVADRENPVTVEGDADILTTLTANPDLTEFASSLQQAFGTEGIDQHLDPMAEWTIFAPVDGAFAYPHTLHTEDTISTYIVQGMYTYEQLWQLAEDADGTTTLTTLGGDELTIEIDGGTLLLEGIAQIRSQLRATNGVVHMIDNTFEQEG